MAVSLNMLQNTVRIMNTYWVLVLDEISSSLATNFGQCGRTQTQSKRVCTRCTSVRRVILHEIIEYNLKRTQRRTFYTLVYLVHWENNTSTSKTTMHAHFRVENFDYAFFTCGPTRQKLQGKNLAFDFLLETRGVLFDAFQVLQAGQTHRMVQITCNESFRAHKPRSQKRA